MYRVISVCDKTDSAIDRLAKGLIPYMNGIDYHVVDVHPKRPDASQLQRFEDLARNADLIDFQYFRTAEMLRGRYEWLKTIPSILTHHNPYSITESTWDDYNVVIANNSTIFNDLKQITHSRTELIPNTIDPYFWTFNDDYKYERSVLMVANRIESKKGILPVAKACKEIGAKMYLVGAISDMNYFTEVMATGTVEFAQEITNEQLRTLYHKAGIHVCNSVDNFESGTLPMLEAIFCGVPVLTRDIGQVPDIKTDDNLVIQDSTPEDTERISTLLNEMFADKKKLDRMRNDAWISVKDRNNERRAYLYQRLYREINPQRSVSVIMPIADKPELTKKAVSAVLDQTYSNVELIVVDDGDEKQSELIKQLQDFSQIPFKYIELADVGYNLAKARNLGIIESTSEILVFCDQRQVMGPNAIEEFVKELKPHKWLYGNKGAKKEFIENFSCILRDDIVTMGMFNERITKYGGMSQECRSRARRQGFDTFYVESAKASPSGKSSNRWRKKMEILESKNLLWKVNLQ